MVVQNYGYTAVQNEKNVTNDLSDAPYYIEPVFEEAYDQETILTPIQKFYDGANVFITGSTGFLGRILVEKLLRSCPTISTLYILVRDKKGKNIEERIDELFEDIIFQRLKEECPKFRHKVVGVSGDCALPNLGLSLQDTRLLHDEINIIFHVAATVRFDEHIKTATAINIRGPRDLVRLAKDMTNLKSFVHVSTVYANCVENPIQEKIYPPSLDGDKLILLTENLPDDLQTEMTPKLLGSYPNTYAYTKQIAESIVRKQADNLPLAIFRPAIVISTYKEPVKSWVNNMYGPTGVSAGAGIGLLRTFYCYPELVANLVPVDMCVNSLIAAAWEVSEQFKEAQEKKEHFEVPVYNYESGNDQPITWSKYMHLTEENGLMYPSLKCIWYYSFTIFRYYPIYLICSFLFHIVPAYLIDFVLLCLGKQPKLVAAYRKIHRFSSVISYFSTRQWEVQSDSLRRQQKRMSEEDRKIFFCDMKQLDWDLYFKTYVQGFRQYLIMDPLESLPEARMRWKRFYYAHQTLKAVLLCGLLWLVYGVIKMTV